MENLKQLIKTKIINFLSKQKRINETIELADKLYFKTGKLSNEDKDLILSITKGNNYTKIISDFYFFLNNNKFLYGSNVMKELKFLYNEIINYDKNVFPIAEYDIFNPKNIGSFIYSLKYRSKIIEKLKSLPSIALRNLKKDIRKERNSGELSNYENLFDYFTNQLSLLSNKPPELQSIIFKKIFKNNTTLNDWIDFLDEKENLLAGISITKEDIKKISSSEDLEIIYEQGDVMIVRVDSPYGIKAIGCNSLWCFTYGSGFESAYKDWNKYSYNDIVYVLIDFREETDSSKFMYLLIEPLTNEKNKLIKYNEDDDNVPLYDMTNRNDENPYSVLNYLFGSKYKTIIKNYFNFDY